MLWLVVREMNRNQELFLQEEMTNLEIIQVQKAIQMFHLQEICRNRELFLQEEMIIQERFRAHAETHNQEWNRQEVTHNREWNHLEVAVLNQECKLQEEIRNREETAKVLDEEEDKLKADLIVGFFVFYYII